MIRDLLSHNYVTSDYVIFFHYSLFYLTFINCAPIPPVVVLSVALNLQKLSTSGPRGRDKVKH